MVEAKFCFSWSDNVNLIGQKMSVLSIGDYDFLNSLQNLSDVNARDQNSLPCRLNNEISKYDKHPGGG